ncbi:MAG: RNA polymerase sporulation sigma factor SigG [Bacilli bacterium]
MARHKVEISGVNTANIKVLTSKEMTELFKKLKTGDISAREQLVNGNLKLVLSILKKFSNRTDNLDDLFQIGCVGLLKAIDNFDLAHNVRFSTYAVPMIAGEVRRYLRDNNSLRISRSLKDIAYKTLKLKEELTNKNNEEPTLKEIAKILEISEFEVINALDAMKSPVSLFEPIYNDGGDTIYLVDQIEDKTDSSGDWDIKIALEKAMNRLKEREKYILDQRFVIGKTQMEIAEEIGISQAQVSRLEKSAIKNIKRMIK